MGWAALTGNDTAITDVPRWPDMDAAYIAKIWMWINSYPHKDSSSIFIRSLLAREIVIVATIVFIEVWLYLVATQTV